MALPIDRVIGEVATHFGGIDILINNAGISIFTPIDGEDYASAWDKTFAVLLTAQTRMLFAQPLPHLRQSTNPRIINIASTEGLGATKFGSPYTAAKHGGNRPNTLPSSGAGGGGYYGELYLSRAHQHRHDPSYPG